MVGHKSFNILYQLINDTLKEKRALVRVEKCHHKLIGDS